MQYLNWLSIQRWAPARIERRAAGLGRGAAVAQRLSAADRSRMGVGRALRGPRRGAVVSVGRRAGRRPIAPATTPTSRRARCCRRCSSPTMTAIPSARRAERSSPNPVGIRDLGGNVAEWIQDFYSTDITENDEARGGSARPGDRPVACACAARAGAARRCTDLRVAARSYSGDAREDSGSGSRAICSERSLGTKDKESSPAPGRNERRP